MAIRILAVLSVVLAPAVAAAGELVMFENAGCGWCRAWHRDVGDAYPKTEEGRRLPLRRVDTGRDPPNELRHVAGVVYTPTFVALACGREIGRITGYPGEAHFYGLLGEIIRHIDKSPESRQC